MAERRPNDRRGKDKHRGRNNFDRDGGQAHGRYSSRRSGPSRQGFREDRMERRAQEPDLPDGIDVRDLDPLILQDLKVLSKDNADAVAKHMIMAIELLDDEPKLALKHAEAAKERAGRVGVVREVNGIVAYRAGEWKEALAELRAARRISGGPGMLAVMADCERGLGKPEKALEISRSPEARDLGEESRIELAIVAAGARHDLGQHESALATLERLEPNINDTSLESARLAYAYADALLALNRTDEAKKWFQHVVDIDVDETTDAQERLEEFAD